ncbi:Bug family tripartite tricarboxylate transporter substrate binding protein [Neoroseomonas soli]|uniref:Tripartite tricarboxylate transporter substrate binding protein n=1 Tax=Neoroseomonas soli TaxID=1081025 RepID=A0A9X9WZF1_9PROT|nr:tripartite tricarboxylate transporter substrate binding protein [Neoroseomonas soli]MBR0672530.1 tripartite tricarboxylate transporter substrate binding protein [Neoroseomonas soli]
MNRRQVLALAAASMVAPAVARAQDQWPGRPVTLLVPFAAGGSNDVVARLIAPALEQKFGQPFVVENRPGGGGSLGMGMVARARPDGLTLLISSASNHVFHPLVSGDLGYDTREALPAACMLVDVPNVLAVHPGFGVTNVQELIAKVRATRGGVSFASSGVGTSNHLAGELFRLRTGIDLTHVPYRGGGPAINDLISGTVPMAFMNLPTVAPPASDGRVRIIAVCTAERVSIRRDLPTVTEQGVPDYAVRSWTGLFAPRGTPAPVIDRLSAAVREALASPQIGGRLVAIGSEPLWMSPSDTDAFVRQEYDRWAPVVRAAGITTQG